MALVDTLNANHVIKTLATLVIKVWCFEAQSESPVNASVNSFKPLITRSPVHFAIGFKKLSQTHKNAGLAALMTV